LRGRQRTLKRKRKAGDEKKRGSSGRRVAEKTHLPQPKTLMKHWSFRPKDRLAYEVRGGSLGGRGDTKEESKKGGGGKTERTDVHITRKQNPECTSKKKKIMNKKGCLVSLAVICQAKKVEGVPKYRKKNQLHKE